jgi:membrane protein insertase Oxa1/YidC/SpoIIIJ
MQQFIKLQNVRYACTTSGVGGGGEGLHFGEEETVQAGLAEGYDPKVTEVNQAWMKALFQKQKNPFTPLMGAFLQAPIFISFFFASRNMAGKLPSFKEGGALWFTDLTTPNSFFI